MRYDVLRSFLLPALIATLFLGLAIPAQAGDTVTLRDGTPVILSLTEQVSSETHHTNDIINMAAARDVEVDGVVVIRVNAPATGRVTWCEENGRVGQAGKLQISVDQVKAADGSTVNLKATLGSKGKDKETQSVALGVVCCPLFLLEKGEHAVYPPGTEIKAYILGDHTFDKDALK